MSDRESERSTQPYWWQVAKVTPLLVATAIGTGWYFENSVETIAFSVLAGLATFALIGFYQISRGGVDGI